MRNFPNALLIITLLAVTCCGRGVGKEEGVSRIATLRGPSAMGMIYMIDSSRQAEGPMKVEIVSEPLIVRKMMLEESVDFAVLPLTMAAAMYNKGIDYQIAAVPVSGSLYLVGSDTAIRGWQDLRGRRVHIMARGMTPDLLFRHLLQKNGIDPERDIEADYGFPDHQDLAGALAAGRASLGIISEPYVSMVLQKNPNMRILMDLGYAWKGFESIPLAETAFLVRRDYAKEHPKQVEAVLQAYRHSTNLVLANRTEAASLCHKYGIVEDASIAFDAIPRSNLQFVNAREIAAQIQAYLNIFFEINPLVIGGKMPDENFYY